MTVPENLAQYDTEENRKAYEALVNGNASSAASTATSQVPDDLAKYDTDENRKAYEAYSKEHAFDNGFTITYNGQTTSYTKEETDLLKRAYQTLNQNADFAKSALESYGNNAFDQFAMQNGLPSWKLFSKVQKYAAGGGVAENYGNLSDEQWKKINELWAKDWEYGLSDQDYARKAAGLAPVSYDSMYEDTLLDQELKAKGLPPSKLLNGKLGEAYRSWQKDAADYTQLLDAATRKYISENAKRENYEPGTFTGFAAAAEALSNVPQEYTMNDALRDTMNSPERMEFAQKHYGMAMGIPNPDDEEFIVKEDGIPKIDENGEYVYNQEKYQKAWDKAVKNNLGIDSDEFAITPEKFQEYYNANAAFTKADMLAAEWFGDNGVDFDYDTRMLNPDYFAKMGDFYIGQTVNEGEGYTLEMLYPGIEFSAEERAYYQPLIDKANQLREKEGYAASEEYLLGGEFAAAAHKVGNDRIVASMREKYADVPGYDKKTDAEILHSYYEGVGKSYLMTDEEIAKLESGEMSLASYMSSKVKNSEDAQAFAEEKYNTYMKTLGLPTDKKGLQEAYYARVMAEEVLSTEADNFKYYDRSLLSMSDEEYEQYWADVRNSSAETPNAGYERAAYDLENVKANADAIRENVRRQDPTYYDGKHKYSAEQVKQLIDNQDATIVSNYADAVSFTDDFAQKTADKEYVNQRFEQIIDKWADSLTHKMDDKIAAYATDDDKAKVVYVYDHTDKNTPEGERITYVDASKYLNKYMMRQWDAERRIDKAEEAGYFGSESDSAFVRWIGGLGTVLASTLASIPQGVANLLVDSVTLLSGHEIYSSNRGTWATDWMGNLSQHLEDKDGNKVGSFAINLIPSMAQSAASMALAVATDGASEAVTLALMASQSYSGAVDSALQNGATSEQAFAYGLLSGANEMIFEKLSLDSFIKNIDVTKAALDAAKASGKYSAKQLTGLLAGKILQHVGTQGFVEGSEEFFTSIANLLAENWILADKSAFNKTVQHYMDGGMSREEAEKLANREIFKDVCVDFIGGYISGAIMAFGGDMIKTSGGRIYVDRSGVTRFVMATHDLSLVSFNDATAYANENLHVDSEGKVSAESAQKVFDALRKQGADAATLSRVMNSYSDNATPDAMTAMQTAIREQKADDGKKLVNAAKKYVYNRQAKGKSDVTNGQIEFATKEWLDHYSGAIQQSDIRELEQAAKMMRAGYVAEISRLARGGSVDLGLKMLDDFYSTLSAEDQQAILKNAEKYKAAFNAAFSKGAKSARYANAAAIMEYAVGNGDAMQGMSAIFGDGAALAPQAIENAILGNEGAHADKFVDMVAEGLSVLQGQNNTHLFAAAQNGVNPMAYVATQFALAQSMPEESLARSMYDYISKYGATNEAMDLLAASTIHESSSPFARQIRITTGTFYTVEQLQQITNDYQKALMDYNEKLKIKEAHEQADAQERMEHEARIANYSEQVAVLEQNVKEDTSLAKTYGDRVSEFQTAQSRLNTLVAEQQQKMAQTQRDVNEAERKYKAAKAKYWNAMQDQAAQYIQRFGSSLEAIKGRQRISHAELMRMSALAQYGTAENLNDINTKIIASEKASAVALGRALGVDVQCVEFNKQFFDEQKIPESERNESAPGVTINGTVFLNTNVMDARVGSLTDQVLIHELGHVLQLSNDNYTKYSKFAKDFLIKRDGKGAYEYAKKAFIESGMTEQQAERELVAEFTRQVALADPRAVAALCKSAPNMSMRVFQWLTNTRNRMSTVASAQSRIIIDAQREFAKGMKAIRNNNAVATQTDDASVSPTRVSMENAMKQLNERMRIEAENQRNAQKQTTEQPAQPTQQTEQKMETPTATVEQQTTQTETPTTTEETPTQPTSEETEQSTETVEEQPSETVEETPEETPTEEQPTEEPQEDFADIVLEEPQGDPDYLGYDAPTEVGKVESIKGETLAEDEWYEDSEGNKYDANGNRIETATKQTEAPTSEQQTEETTETATEQGVNLPFELTDETRQRIMRVVAQLRTKNADSEGRVPKKTNDAIANVVKNQVTHDANYVDTPADVLDAFAEQFKAPQNDVAPENENDIYERQRRLMQGSTRNAPSQFNEEADPSRMNSAFADIQQDVSIPRAQYYTEYDPFEIDRRINSTRRQISQIEHDLGWEYEDNEFDKKRLAKLNNELHGLVEQERKATVKTSLGEVLENLMRYRKNDLISIANQLTDGAFDDVEELSASELRDSIREIINGRELSALEMQMRSIGVWVRPAMDAQAVAIYHSIEGLSERENMMSGQPRMIQTDNGYVVARKVSREGFMTGNPMFNTKRQNIALIAPVSEFNGDVKRPVGPSRCTAVVVPNTDAYAGTRADARDAGANVYAYDESDPSQFDRAIDRAANMSSVAYFPSMTYDELIARYKAIPQGMKPRVDGRVVPQQTTDTNRVSRAARTAIESPITTDETAEDAKSWIVDDGAGTFEPVSNMKSLNRARSVIERAGSVSQAAEDLHSAVANNDGKATDLLARAELLYAEAQNPNSGLTAIQREHIFSDLCMIASDAGRALQLTAQLKRMTPEGHIDYIEQVGKRIADKYEKRTKKHIDTSLTPEEIDAYKGAVTEEQRDAIDKEVSKRWGEQMKDLPLTDRIRNWRYFSMLGNPRTHFRNMVGNALMNPVARAKDFNNTWLQRIFEHVGNEDTRLAAADRTTTYWTGRVDATTKDFVNEQLKRLLPVMQQGSSKYMEDIVKTPATQSDNEGSWWERTKAVLTEPVNSARLSNAENKWGKFWNNLSYINSNALELEDAMALGMRFRSAMYQIIKARNIDVTNITNDQLNAITNYAMEESLRATFRDASKLADALNRFANTNRATQFAMEAIVPFKKTPINIAKRSFEYSPLGLVNGLYKLATNSRQYNTEIANINSDTRLTDEQKAKRIEQATAKAKAQKVVAIDRLASGVTGTTLSALGFFMASMGWVSIGRKDDDEASFEQSLGKNAYSLNIGDLSIDLSAFSPAAVPLLMGTALYESTNAEHDPNFVSTVLDVLAESVDPITEMSMISGIADALSGIGTQREDGANTRWAMQIAGNAAESYIGQFIPTAAGQIARMLDPYSRSYTAGDDYWATKAFGSEIGTSVKKLQNKIPFVAWLSEPKVNIHGEDQRNYTNFGAGLAHILNNTIAPATIKMDQKNDVDEELIRLYGVVDTADIFPTKPSRNLGMYNGEQIKLTSDKEYMQYQKEYGQTVYDLLNDLMTSREYKYMTDEQRANAIEKIIDQAKSATKKRWKAMKATKTK